MFIFTSLHNGMACVGITVTPPSKQPDAMLALSKHEVVRAPELKDIAGKRMWQATVEIIGTFKQNLDLRNFPLDCHTLKIHIEMGNSKDMVYMPVQHVDSMLSLDTRDCALYGWIWSGVRMVFGQTDPKLSKLGNSYSYFEVHFNIAREWKPYFWRIGIINMFITQASILTFVMHPSNAFSDRVSYLVTLLLTLVAFLYTVQERLPAVGYVTLLEKDILFSFFTLFVLLLQSGITSYFISTYTEEDNHEAAYWWLTADRQFGQWCSICLVCRYLLFVVYCICMRKQEKSRLRVCGEENNNSVGKALIRREDLVPAKGKLREIFEVNLNLNT